jgi:hypothetical protein
MSDDLIPSLLATWAARNLPARLDTVTTAKLLGFAEHEIQILMALGKLTPLGDPAPNAPKWFSALEVLRLAADQDWLHKSTREISKYWRHKRERSGCPRPFGKKSSAKTSPDSSPRTSPSEQFADGSRAIPSGEKIVSEVACTPVK